MSLTFPNRPIYPWQRQVLAHLAGRRQGKTENLRRLIDIDRASYHMYGSGQEQIRTPWHERTICGFPIRVLCVDGMPDGLARIGDEFVVIDHKTQTQEEAMPTESRIELKVTRVKVPKPAPELFAEVDVRVTENGYIARAYPEKREPPSPGNPFAARSHFRNGKTFVFTDAAALGRFLAKRMRPSAE